MTYAIHSLVGAQPITDHSTTQNHPLGLEVDATDPTYGPARFIYLLGVASTAVGSVVTFDASTYQTVLSAVGGNIPRPIAVAMSANVANEYGWYQIVGQAVMKKQCTVSLAAGAAVGIVERQLHDCSCWCFSLPPHIEAAGDYNIRSRGPAFSGARS